MSLRFVWDEDEVAANPGQDGVCFDEDGVCFDEAVTAFGDPLSLTIDSPHDASSCGRVLVGRSARDRLVVVVHEELDAYIRLIGARLATPAERRTYDEEE